jgi:ferric-dicitrate binding protein FerR (iron transport regulator)
MTQQRFEHLLAQFKNDCLSGEELEEFRQLVGSGAYDGQLEGEILRTLQEKMSHPEWTKDKEQALLDHLHEKLAFTAPVNKGRFRRMVWLRAAAAIFVVCLSGSALYYHLQHTGKGQDGATITRPPIAIIPGGNKATLTLAGGRIIVLDSTHGGEIGRQGGTQVIKLDSGSIAYHETQETGGSVQYNTITTPRGGQYQVILPDGTHVWLNSASSLYFPTSFRGPQRSVTLSGEGYFEVAKNRQMPFVVKVGEMEINVLGTRFNVMAYDDEESIQTTLVQGSIKVNAAQQDILVPPGQQAVLPHNTGRLHIAPANVDETIAWTKGRFFFEDRPIASIMRQVARWYDVDIVYKDSIPGVALSGMVSRRADAEGLLKILEATKRVRFTTSGRQITVMPYQP